MSQVTNPSSFPGEGPMSQTVELPIGPDGVISLNEQSKDCADDEDTVAHWKRKCPVSGGNQ